MKDVKQDVIRVIEELLRGDIKLKDVEKWIDKHPCLCRQACREKNICSSKNLAILSKFKKLTQKPVNNNEWQDFRYELKTNPGV